MARPNLSVSSTSLVVTRWSSSQLVIPSRPQPKARTSEESAFCQLQTDLNGKGHRRASACEHFLSNGSFRSREAQAFPPEPLGDYVTRAPAAPSPPPPKPGYARRLRQSETQCHYRCARKNRGASSEDGSADRHGCVVRVFSTAASANGAMTLKPAAFGCSPSSLKSFFNIPLWSTIALK